jgi:hypothetical protein
VARPLRLTISGLVGVRASSSRMRLAFSIVIRRIIAPLRVLTKNHASPQAPDRADAPWRLAVSDRHDAHRCALRRIWQAFSGHLLTDCAEMAYLGNHRTWSTHCGVLSLC